MESMTNRLEDLEDRFLGMADKSYHLEIKLIKRDDVERP